MNENTKLRPLKKQANHVALGLIGYHAILYIGITVVIIGKLIYICCSEKNPILEEQAYYRYLEEIENSGFYSIVAILIGMGFLMVHFRKDIFFKHIFEKKQQMTGKKFVRFILAFMSTQLIFTLLANGVEALLQSAGFTAMQDMESATAVSTTISMFLYACIFGPVIEEFIYRGWVMRIFEKYGKQFAIVASSILFGMMHGNIYQIPDAFVAGLVLGYVAMNYSIWWSVALHIVNNCLFGDILGFLISGFSENVQEIINWGLLIVFFIAGMFVLWRERGQIQQYFKENKNDKKQFKIAFTAIWMIVFIVMEVLLAIGGIEKM